MTMNIIGKGVLVIGAVAALSVAAADIDFDATTSGGFVLIPTPPTAQVMIQHTTVTATPFSFSSLIATETVVYTTTPWTLANGVFSFWNSAGESLFGTFSGQLVPDISNPNSYTVTDAPWSISGGTGQFTGMTGSGLLDATITLTSAGGGTSEIVWEGTVVPEASPLALLGLGAVGLAVWRRRQA